MKRELYTMALVAIGLAIVYEAGKIIVDLFS